ncbi:MAG: hypothetical protein WCW27_00300 [Patescibacteria group bacterium]|jgi:hypothetical protein
MTTIQDGTQYIQQCRQLGFTDAEIVSALRKANWQETDIQAALLKVLKTKKHSIAKIILYIIIVVTGVLVLATLGLTAYLLLIK